MEINPLRNELVLANVLARLPPKELTSCRLVCKHWNHEATFHLRKQATLNFTGYNEKYIEKFTSTMKDAVAESADLHEFPYTKFIMTIWDQETLQSGRNSFCAPQIRYATETFFNTFGVCITSLQLSINDFEKVLLNHSCRTWLAKNLENLHDLVLVGQSSIGIENKSMASIYVDITQTLAKLHTLSLVDKFGECDNDAKFQKRFTTQFVLNAWKMCPNITELSVDTMDCKTPCSLAESVLQALKMGFINEIGVPKLHRLSKFNLRSVAHSDNLTGLAKAAAAARIGSQSA